MAHLIQRGWSTKEASDECRCWKNLIMCRHCVRHDTDTIAHQCQVLLPLLLLGVWATILMCPPTGTSYFLLSPIYAYTSITCSFTSNPTTFLAVRYNFRWPLSPSFFFSPSQSPPWQTTPMQVEPPSRLRINHVAGQAGKERMQMHISRFTIELETGLVADTDLEIVSGSAVEDLAGSGDGDFWWNTGRSYRGSSSSWADSTSTGNGYGSGFGYGYGGGKHSSSYSSSGGGQFDGQTTAQYEAEDHVATNKPYAGLKDGTGSKVGSNKGHTP